MHCELKKSALQPLFFRTGLVCCLIKHHAVEDMCGLKVHLYVISNVTLDKGEISVSLPGRFTPAERADGVLRTGSWVDPRVRQTQKSKC